MGFNNNNNNNILIKQTFTVFIPCVCVSPFKFWSCICIGDMFQRLVKNKLKTALENATKPKHELKCGKMLSNKIFKIW